MTTDAENAADASEFREECRRDQEAEARARSQAMSKRLQSQLATVALTPPGIGRVRDPETGYVYRAELGTHNDTPGWLLHPVCRERYVDGDCPFPVHAVGLCELHYSRYRHQAAGQLDCAMDAPKREFPEGPMKTLSFRVPRELVDRCLVSAARAGVEWSEWLRCALDVACSMAPPLEKQAKEKP